MTQPASPTDASVPSTTHGRDRRVRAGSPDMLRGYDVQILTGPDRQRAAVERELDAAGVALPLQVRHAWGAVEATGESIFGVVRGGHGRALYGFGGHIGRSRAYPGFSIVRVQRFGGECEPGAARAAIEQLTTWARSHRVLRLHIEVHTTSDALRAAIADACMGFGFRRPPMRSYARTVMLDLSPPPELIFGSLHATARRHIRAVEKRAVDIRVIDDPQYAERMNELLRESLERSGGQFEPQPFGQVIRFANEHPALARVVGLFRSDVTGPAALLAFAVGYHHGSHTEYAEAGCTRQSDVRMPLMYGLAWDLIVWSRDNGARWFDFGGVRGDDAPGDATDGIADFKRYFVRDVVDIADEWVLEPRPVRAAVARGIAFLARWGKSVLDGSRSWERARRRGPRLETAP